MPTALEITSRAIRYCCITDSALTALGSVPINADQDPIEALKLAPLPENLGKVTVLLQHADMLQQTMIQPPCPLDRLDRIVRFELLSLVPDVNLVLCNYSIAPIGSGDMRLLVNIAKRSLVDQINDALKPHGGTLSALSLPATGLFECWKTLHSNPDSDDFALVVDIGGKNSHIAIVKGEQLVFTRSHKGGLDDIVEGIAGLRGIDEGEARTLVARLGSGAPEDVRNLVRNAAHSMSTSLTSVMRFASAQLKIPPISPTTIFLAGAGGQIPEFVSALAERSKIQVRLINPFANTISRLDLDKLDHMVALPSPWAAIIGAARSTSIPLDVMAQARAEKVAYWSTHGILRVAAIASVALMILALARQWYASGTAASAEQRLSAAESGLVPKAQAAEQDLMAVLNKKNRDRDRVDFLRQQQVPGKIAIEFLGAVAQSINPQTRRVHIQRYQVFQSAEGMRILMTGTAQASGSNNLGDVLDGFHQDLRSIYPSIQSITDLGSNIVDNSMVFQWELSIGDHASTTVPANPQPNSRNTRGSRSGS